MSIFGDLDVDEIGDDPFYTAPATYRASCTDAIVKTKDGKTSLMIKWTIDEPGNEYHGNNVSEFYPLFPGREWDELDADEKKRIKFLKKRLREGFDFSETEMRSINPSGLIGKVAFITVVVNEGKDQNAGKKFTNVNEALCPRLMQERNGQNAELATDLGM